MAAPIRYQSKSVSCLGHLSSTAWIHPEADNQLQVPEINTMDLSKPWSNTDQFLWTSYPKPNNTNAAMDPPTLNDGAMWSDGSSLLLFGGALSRARGASPVIPPQGTWKYDILQDAWTNQGFNGARMQRIHLGVTAQSSTNEGYYLGGAITPASDPLFNSIPGAQPYMVSGLVTLQEDDLSFNNLSTVGMNSYNTMTAGYMVLIESLGESGILVAFGGITNSVGSAMGFAPDDLDFPGIQVRDQLLVSECNTDRNRTPWMLFPYMILPTRLGTSKGLLEMFRTGDTLAVA